jgi:hypothetical protein
MSLWLAEVKLDSDYMESANQMVAFVTVKTNCIGPWSKFNE